MPDDKTQRGEPDRTRINIHEDYEREYWSKKFGCTEDELRSAVKHVGPMVDDVRRQLGN